jgi:hypothetical protein
MRKNKAVRRKKLRGGDIVNFKNAAIRGILSTNNLYNKAYQDPNVNKIPDLIETYQRDKKKLLDNVEKLNQEKDRITKNQRNVSERNLKITEIENKQNVENRKYNLTVIKYIVSLVGALWQNIKDLSSFIFKTGGSIFNFAGFAGNGVILRVLLLLVFLAFIFGLLSAFSPSFRDINNYKINDLINPDYDNYLSGPNPFKGIKDMFGGLNNLIPSDFKYKFTSLTNSINYITTGRNQYEDFLEPRETTETGRSDNIIHMNFNNQPDFQKDKTYCSLSPKPIILKFDSNLYPTSDYNKLDETLRKDLNYPMEYNIPIIGDKITGRFSLNIDSSKYINSIGSTTTTLTDDKYKYLSKLLKKNKNEIILNEYKPISFNIVYSIISMYGNKLLNNKYKDRPIMVITDFNKYNSKISLKRSLYYNETTNKYQYYNEENKLEDFEFKKHGKTFYEIEMLLDQSGNNRHFVWKDNDNKNKPKLIFIALSNEYAIEFTSKMILYQNIPIEFPKMFIKSTISMNNQKINKIEDDYMDFLSAKTTSSIKLQLISDKNKFVVKTNNKEYENIEYFVNKKEIIMTNLDNGKIETIGSLTDKNVAHNFNGLLYDLYIYDRSKM